MYQRILIATDGSELATKAVQHGTKLASTLGASVVFVTVTRIWSALKMATDMESGELEAIKAYEAAAARSAEAILKACAEHATSQGVSSTLRHVSDYKPAEGILKIAKEDQCDLIVMATHGRRGLEKMMIGSETAKVLAMSATPVLVLH